MEAFLLALKIKHFVDFPSLIFSNHIIKQELAVTSKNINLKRLIHILLLHNHLYKAQAIHLRKN